jgi:hypothetical protein
MANDYAIFEGEIGNWYSHDPLVCSVFPFEGSYLFAPSLGNNYYLVVPLSDDDEGSYGLDSGAAERPAGTSTCRPAQTVFDCP